jgi:hypothetical protein
MAPMTRICESVMMAVLAIIVAMIMKLAYGSQVLAGVGQ